MTLYTKNGLQVKGQIIDLLKDNYVLVKCQDRLVVAERLKWTDDEPCREIKTIFDIKELG